MGTTMTYTTAPAWYPERASNSGYTGKAFSQSPLDTDKSGLYSAIRKRILTASAKEAKPRLYFVFPVFSAEPPTISEHIFATIKALYLSNTFRNRRIAQRLKTLYRDALADNEDIVSESIDQFRDFFLANPGTSLPKITLTPDGTLRVRWIHGPNHFVAIEFTGEPLVKLVAEIPGEKGATELYVINYSVQDIFSVAQSIDASFE